MSFIHELKRRNVIRVASGYAVGAWLLIQIIDTVARDLWIDEEAFRLIVIISLIGFPIALILAWVFQITPEGLKLDDKSELKEYAPNHTRNTDRVIIVTLIVAVSYFAIDRYVVSTNTSKLNTTASIAVIPFDACEVESKDKYFVDGVTNEIRNLLSRFEGLRVIATNSSNEFRCKTKPMPIIAEELGVSYLLSGSIIRFDEFIQINAQLFKAKERRQIWGDSYENQLQDLFKIQDEIAANVVSNLHIKLIGDVPKSDYVDPEILELTAEAYQLSQERAQGTGKKMQALLDRILNIDPNYIPALDLKVINNWFLMDDAYTFEEMKADADRIYARILELDPDSALPDFWYGSILAGENKFEEAAIRYDAALNKSKRQPEYLTSDNLRAAGYFALHLGKINTAINIFSYALSIDPMCFQCRRRYAESLMYANNYKEAQWQFERYLFHAKEGWEDYVFTLLLQNKPTEAIAFLESTNLTGIADAEEDWTRLFSYGLQAIAYYINNNDLQFKKYKQLVDESNYDDERSVRLVQSLMAAWTGDIDIAFTNLNQLAASNFQFLQKRTFSPVWQNLHDDPRWLEYRAVNGTSAKRLNAIQFSPKVSEMFE